ncbi:MAG: type II 3-dehydroquinate dehydratase [Bacteroidetes bacterium]|nr:type II 3-dehydroquinate dehydratase [Bacteroidota bacterium]
MKLVIINGPNLNLLGQREPGIYGNTTFENYLEELKSKFDVELEYFQSNSEGELVDEIQSAGFNSDGIVINAGAYTHTSVAIADAVRAIDAPVIEVHISNTASRETFRHNSYLAPVCLGTITGFGLNSYELAIRAFLMHGK